ncbi:HD domain-containing protein [Eubacteriales bacterium OttesenSCG-928-N13]|nr:HD domain-containing protein [Eubacteriales bacterium OttesenSCG-928-N13]
MLKGQIFDGFLLIKSAEQRTSSNGSKYLDLTLQDLSGDVNGKMWDGTVPAPKTGTVVRLRGAMLEYNNRPQMRVDRMRESTEADGVDMGMLIPCAPYPADEMMDALLSRANAIGDEQLRELVLFRLNESRVPLMYFPAAARLHHAERSGLLHHTSTMLKTADAICAVYPQLDSDLLAAGVMLHDLSKLTEINSDELGLANEYTVEGNLLGHIVKGVSELDRAGRELGTRKELLLMLEHMILSHHDLPEYGSPKKPMFPEAEVLHVVDLLDARMYEMSHALQTVQPGAFSEKIWSLERKLYRRKEQPIADQPEAEPTE